MLPYATLLDTSKALQASLFGLIASYKAESLSLLSFLMTKESGLSFLISTLLFPNCIPSRNDITPDKQAAPIKFPTIIRIHFSFSEFEVIISQVLYRRKNIDLQIYMHYNKMGYSIEYV